MALFFVFSPSIVSIHLSSKPARPDFFFPPSPFDLLYFVIITIIIRFLFFYYYFVEGYVSKEQEKKMWLL